MKQPVAHNAKAQGRVNVSSIYGTDLLQETREKIFKNVCDLGAVCCVVSLNKVPI